MKKERAEEGLRKAWLKCQFDPYNNPLINHKRKPMKDKKIKELEKRIDNLAKQIIDMQDSWEVQEETNRKMKKNINKLKETISMVNEETPHETPKLPKDEQNCNHSFIGIDSTLRFGKCKVCGKQVVESKGQGWEEEFDKKFVDFDGDLSSHNKAEHDENFLFIKGDRVKNFIKQRFIEKEELIKKIEAIQNTYGFTVGFDIAIDKVLSLLKEEK